MQELADSLIYDPLTGEFTWKVSSPRRKAGSKAGGVSGAGYVYIGFQKKTYLAHRVAWFIMKGEVPDYIDHIDGDRTNNAWNNLRSVSKKENHRIRGTSSGRYVLHNDDSQHSHETRTKVDGHDGDLSCGMVVEHETRYMIL